MNIHILSDSIYTKNFIEFTENNFLSRNEFYVYTNSNSKYVDYYKTKRNITLFENTFIFIKHYSKFKNANKILIHQLNHPQLLLFWLVFYPNIFNKLMWIIWGGDLYFYKSKSNSLKDRLIEIIRKFFIKKIKFISSYIKGDYDLCTQVYGPNAKYFPSLYPGTIDIEFIKNQIEKPASKTINILIGNSASEDNLHLEALNMLEAFKNEDIKLYLVMSYGGSTQYVKSVLEFGKKIFSDKLEIIQNYMDSDEYFSFINTIDICVLSHNRQQGLGNVNLLLCLQKKLYLKKSVTTFGFLKNLGIEVYDTWSIKSSTFSDFCKIDKNVTQENKKKMLDNLNESRILNEWKTIIDGNW